MNKNWLNYINEKDMFEFVTKKLNCDKEQTTISEKKSENNKLFEVTENVDSIDGLFPVKMLIGDYGIMKDEKILDIQYSPVFEGTEKIPAYATNNYEFLHFMLNHIPENERELFYDEYALSHESIIYSEVFKESENYKKEIKELENKMKNNSKVLSNIDSKINKMDSFVKNNFSIEPERDY